MTTEPTTAFAQRLDHADRFVDAAIAVCDEAARLGVSPTWIALRYEHGPFALVIDNSPDRDDEIRIARVTTHTWDHDPVCVAMRAHVAPVGFERGYSAPLVGHDGWFGIATWPAIERPTRALERELTMLATRLSVWCTQHGVVAVPVSRAPTELGPRQYRIAQLAASGQSNVQIGAALGISINTVKARLKEVFDRLDVASRTELAHAMLRRAPLDGIAPGITRLATATVTRAIKPPRTDQMTDQNGNG